MIFSIEKRRFRRGGKVEETRSYYLRYRIGDMPVDKCKSPGVTDKQVADQKAHKFIQEREREAAGILEPQAVRDSARKPLAAHLDDYVADLAARGPQWSRGAWGAAGSLPDKGVAASLRLAGAVQCQRRFIHRLR